MDTDAPTEATRARLARLVCLPCLGQLQEARSILGPLCPPCRYRVTRYARGEARALAGGQPPETRIPAADVRARLAEALGWALAPTDPAGLLDLPARPRRIKGSVLRSYLAGELAQLRPPVPPGGPRPTIRPPLWPRSDPRPLRRPRRPPPPAGDLDL